MTCLPDFPASIANKFTCVPIEFLSFTTLYVATINFYVATLFQCVFIDFSLHFSRQGFKHRDNFFLPFTLFFVAIFISMSRQNSGASSGALLRQCRDRGIKCRDRGIKCCDNTAFRIPLCCDIHFRVATFFLYFSYYVAK